MLKKIKLNDKEINFVLKSNPLAKRIRIIIHQNGRIVITKPKRASAAIALNFLKSQSSFILRRLQELEDKNKDLFGLTGESNINDYFKSQKDYQKNKLAASVFIKERLDFFNQFYKLKYGRVSIRNQSTRWGSCSRQGNLNFNYRLFFLPKELADYIIVHELCHLKELNHSVIFWELVKQVIPDFRQKRQRLKGYL